MSNFTPVGHLLPFIVCAFALLSTHPSAGAERNKVYPVSIEEISRKKLHHLADGSFYNPWCDSCVRGYTDLLRWQLSKNPYAEEKKTLVSFKVLTPGFAALEAAKDDYAVWLGHSTVLIKSGKMRILTDPIFGDINFLLKRKTPFPVDPANLPHIDIVLISHNHYDHLNTASIKLLVELFNPLFITGPGYDEYFASITKKHITLDWWEAYAVDDLKITSLPAQHWSKRGIFDANTMLWCSFAIEGKDGRYFWAGDTGYYRGFKEIGEKFGPFDTVFLPIGSYEPRWFMKENHLNPEEALKAAEDLRARTFIPIHWGTFDLTDEPLQLPIKKLKEVYGIAPRNPGLTILEHGGTWKEGAR